MYKIPIFLFSSFQVSNSKSSGGLYHHTTSPHNSILSHLTPFFSPSLFKTQGNVVTAEQTRLLKNLTTEGNTVFCSIAQCSACLVSKQLDIRKCDIPSLNKFTLQKFQANVLFFTLCDFLMAKAVKSNIITCWCVLLLSCRHVASVVMTHLTGPLD